LDFVLVKLLVVLSISFSKAIIKVSKVVIARFFAFSKLIKVVSKAIISILVLCCRIVIFIIISERWLLGRRRF